MLQGLSASGLKECAPGSATGSTRKVLRELAATSPGTPNTEMPLKKTGELLWLWMGLKRTFVHVIW